MHELFEWVLRNAQSKYSGLVEVRDAPGPRGLFAKSDIPVRVLTSELSENQG